MILKFKKEKKEIKIFVYALCNVYYDAYYIKGLKDYFQCKKIIFTLENFPRFDEGTFAVIIKNGNYKTKIIIDSRDTNLILEEQLIWSDVYGKVNYDNNVIPEKLGEKIFAIGPSFGIKIWNFYQTIFFALKNYLNFSTNIKNKREFIANYWRQYKRLRLSKYKPEKSLKKYIFFTGTLWKNEMETNLFRSYFIIACKNNNAIKFEGGFAPRKDSQNLGFDLLITTGRYAFKEYIQKIKKTSIVFNTPAVLSCHGWKLAEFLAMGKAIIATKNKNILPSPLIENFHVQYVFPEITHIEKGVNNIIDDEVYKLFLEKNARDYFEKYLAPEKVIEFLYFAKS